MTKIFLNGIVSLIMLGSLWALPASAQSPDSKTATPEAEPAAGSGASQFGDLSSVGGTLNRDSEAKAAVPTRVHVVDQYLDFKKRVEKRYGLSFGFDYNALLQTASQNLGEDTAAGGVFRPVTGPSSVETQKIRVCSFTRWKTVTAWERILPQKT